MTCKSIAILLFSLVVLSTTAFGALTCDVKQTCAGDEYAILNLNNYTNSHVELVAYSNYDYHICCKDTTSPTDIGTSCVTGTKFLGLNNETNSHVENPSFSNYTNDACISAADITFTCDYVGNSNCTGYDTCLVTLDNETNSHVAECGTVDSYNNSVCCNLSYDDYILPVVDDISTNVTTFSKYDYVRWVCDGEEEYPVQQMAEWSVKFSLTLQGDASYDSNDFFYNESMTWDPENNEFYIERQVLEDGGQEYKAKCIVSDGINSAQLEESCVKSNGQVGDCINVSDDWDDDGIGDSEDTVEGTTNNMITDIGSFDVTIGSESINSLTSQPTTSQNVVFKDGATDLVEFNHDFNSEDLVLNKVKVFRRNIGQPGTLVKGLSGKSKTFKVSKNLGHGVVCVKNSEVDSFDEISAGCDNSDEIFFNSCDVGGQTINGITCEDIGLYYQISGLENSAVVEMGDARLSIWDEGANFLGSTKTFYANYTNSTSGETIVDGICEIWFEDTGTTDTMDFSSGVIHNYTRVFSSSGNYNYNVSCTSSTYDDLNVTDAFTISLYSSAVPEFSEWMMIFATIGTLIGLVVFRRK